jgi:hypothetical protein
MHDDFEVTPVAVRDCEIAKTIRNRPGPFAHGHELARVQIIPTGPKPKTKGEAALAGVITLSDGTLLQDLIDSIGAVVRRILREFEPTISGKLL